MLPRKLEDLTHLDLEALVSGSVAEGKRLDFKSELPARKPEDAREFAADVASFANAEGGDIVFGVVEKASVAVRVPGISSPDLDADIRRLEQIVQSSIEPRVSGVRFQVVVGGTQPSLVVRVPRGWWGLHMVTANGLQRFVARNAKGKYPLDVHEIRTGFLAGVEAETRARAFHRDRVASIRLGEPPVKGPWAHGVVMHCVPVAHRGHVDLRRARPLLALHPTGVNHRYTIDGLLGEAEDSYTLLGREGTLETASADLTESQILPSLTICESLIRALSEHMTRCRMLEIPAPLFVLVTLFGLTGKTLPRPTEWGGSGYYSSDFDRDEIHLPSVVVESLDIEPANVLRPLLDGLWQAAGVAACSYYDSEGRWAPRR